MFGLFSGNKGTKAPAKSKEQSKDQVFETINKLNTQINDIEEKMSHLEAKKNGQVAIAKEKLAKGDKTGAKQALKKKKGFDDQIKTLDGAMMMLEEQKMMLDGTMTLGSISETLKGTNEVIKSNMKEMNLDEFDQIRDDIEEQKANFEEVNEFFKEYSAIDDPDLDDELDQLENEMQENKLPSVSEKKKEEIIVPGVKEVVRNDDEKNLEDFLS